LLGEIVEAFERLPRARAERTAAHEIERELLAALREAAGELVR
jgi:hypothetical protein